jgi:hypothetical protein
LSLFSANYVQAMVYLDCFWRTVSADCVWVVQDQFTRGKRSLGMTLVSIIFPRPANPR